MATTFSTFVAEAPSLFVVSAAGKGEVGAVVDAAVRIARFIGAHRAMADRRERGGALRELNGGTAGVVAFVDGGATCCLRCARNGNTALSISSSC